jgi:nucleoside-diphosphate-sugar epimerase
MTTAPNPQRTALVLGAAGRLGAAAVQAFAAAGWTVLAQARRPQALPAGARVLALPLQDSAGLAAAAAGARVVVYGVNPLYTRWDQEMLPLARQGMDIAERLGATFMLPGNVYNFGEGMPALLHTTTPARPSTRKGELRVQLEDELRQRAAAGRLGAVVLRAGDFFGAGGGSWLDLAIAKDIARGKLAYPGPLDTVHAWAYLPDLARAFVAVAEQAPAAPFQCLHFAGHAVTGREFIAALEQAAAGLGLQPPDGWRHGSLPWGLMRVLGLVNPMVRELVRMSYLWRVPHALDGSALQQAVGPLAATPLVAALRAALQAQGVGAAAPAGPAASTLA